MSVRPSVTKRTNERHDFFTDTVTESPKTSFYRYQVHVEIRNGSVSPRARALNETRVGTNCLFLTF